MANSHTLTTGQLDTYSHKHVELLLYTSCTLLKDLLYIIIITVSLMPLFKVLPVISMMPTNYCVWGSSANCPLYAYCVLLLYRVVSVLGYVPQDLVGEVSYQYYHPDDLHRMVQLHQNGLCVCVCVCACVCVCDERMQNYILHVRRILCSIVYSM